MVENCIVNGLITISNKEFDLISKLIYDKFGINLTEQKKPLVQGRLNKIIRQLGFNTFMEYYHSVINDESGQSLSLLIDKISTNHTYFFREKEHFDLLNAKILPEIVNKLKLEGRKDLKIWCAGCASGEESYTLAIVLNEYFQADFTRLDIGILSTDISTTVLNQAIKGIYPTEKIKDMPIDYKRKYLKVNDQNTFSVVDSLKEINLFKRLNLMNTSYPFKGKFDIIFCRNVMIYFNIETRKELVKRFSQYLNPGGYFFIGHSESLGRDNTDFKYISPAVYKKL